MWLKKHSQPPLKEENGLEGERHLTCDVNISRGGVQGCGRPGSTAVAGSDAFES